MIQTKRIYSAPAPTDGYRVLVDRLWPRGVSKERAHLDLWLKEVAPSPDLRRWFGHVPDRFDAFAERYRRELDANPAWTQLKNIVAQHRVVTLLYAAKDEKHNEAVVLQDRLTTCTAPHDPDDGPRSAGGESEQVREG